MPDIISAESLTVHNTTCYGYVVITNL